MRETKVSLKDGELRVGHPFGGAYLRSRSLIRLMDRSGVREVPITTGAEAEDGGLRLFGGAHDFAVEATWTKRDGQRCAYFDVEVQIRYQGAGITDTAVQVAFDLAGEGRPTWMIPGAFYKENRLSHCTRIYPRYDFEGGDSQQLVSDAWAFRSDRTALPAVFAWNAQGSAALATAETSPMGITGVGFKGNAEGTALYLNFPYREDPVVFLAPGKPGPADCPLYRWAPGEAVTLRYRVYLGGPDLHAYDPFVRELYALDQQEHGLNPWMGLRKAAELTAWGLYRWHYEPKNQILMETAAFDREGGMADRQNMHVGWVSGAPYAFALLAHGREHAEPNYVEAAQNVLSKIASGVSPCGCFWGEWRADRGWSQGWTPNKKWIQARTISEATLFMIRAIRFEEQRGYSHPDWREAALSNLRYISSIQREDGSYGAYYFADNGEVMEWEGAGGILWVAAMLEGAELFGEPGFRASALKAGEYYRRFVEDEFIYGAPEDVHLCPTSEDGYNAVVAYVSLYEADRSETWLKLAAQAADWTMTFRWTYNLAWPEPSMLAFYDFRSRGADQASPSNQHLHNYGLFATPEMLRLWQYTGDRYYLDRTRDNLACFLQFIARADGDFNAYKGMVTERYYNTNCFQPKGMMLTLSHSWSVGVTLYASRAALPYEGELKL